MRPNKLNGTLSNAAVVIGKVGQSLAFSEIASSYLQVYGCYQLSRGVLMHKSTGSNSSGRYLSFIGTNYSGQITMVVATSYNLSVVSSMLSVIVHGHISVIHRVQRMVFECIPIVLHFGHQERLIGESYRKFHDGLWPCMIIPCEVKNKNTSKKNAL